MHDCSKEKHGAELEPLGLVCTQVQHQPGTQTQHDVLRTLFKQTLLLRGGYSLLCACTAEQADPL